MALVKCPDCGKMVSDRVMTCPQCGCPSEFFENNLEVLNNENAISSSEIIKESITLPENQTFVKGQIFDLCENGGRIKVPKRKELVRFYADSLVGITIQELNIGDFVEYLEIRRGSRDIVCKMRKSPVEWLKGTLVEIQGEYLHIQYNDELRNRMFWSRKEDICFGENISEFALNDSVLFQCGGFFDSSNHVNMVTKKILGYITYFDHAKATGLIDFKYRFTEDCVNNMSRLEDIDNSFLLVSYQIREEQPDQVKDITIIKKTKEIIFDGQEEWIDGVITRKEISKAGAAFAVISSPVEKSKATFKFNATNMDAGCNFDDITELQRVSFRVDEMAYPQKVAWSGYITRFPVYQDVVDSSGRIDCHLVKGNVEKKNSSLLYFRKYKIHDLKNNVDYTRYWIETVICGDKKIVPIKTANSSIRYKVKFAYSKDPVYDKKAVRIHILGISKFKIEDETSQIDDNININESETINQMLINNYYYGDVYNNSTVNNLNILQINSANDFLKLIAEGQLGTYIENIYRQSANKCYDANAGQLLLDDAKANEIADKIFPHNIELSKENLSQLEDTFNVARNIHPEVTDTLLKQVSENCGLYIKIAIIVEYALQDLTPLSVNDNSAQMVMYGKALEQGLRDSLFDFIMDDDELKNYSDKKGYTFSKLVRDKACIGNFTSIMQNKMERFVQLCIHKQKNAEKNNEEWICWWTGLYEDTNNARQLRNSSDHAGTKVESTAIEEMTFLLFGGEGILNKLILIDKMSEISPKNNIESENKEIFIGHHISGTSLIVGRLLSGEKAALHITEVKNAYTSFEEFQEIFEKSKNGIEVKTKKTDKGVSVSLK